MEHLIIIYTAENKAWFSYKSKQTNSQHQIDIRANVLFIRSVTTSCSMVVSALNTFVHPHIATLIPLLLDSYASFGLENIKDLKGLKDDASNCLSVIGNKVPARLLVPALSGSVEGFMKHGHVASLRLANLVLQVAKSNDRATVLSNLPKWISLSLELMDYRRKHGDYTNATDEVEDVVCESVVALCLKLTESELKAFILKVVEWRSSSENAKEKEKSTLSRSSSFYALIKTLVDHLKFLFYPTMALFWADTLEDLVLVKTKITKLIEAAANVEDSSAKKRKRGDLMRVVLNEDDQGMVNELLSLAKVVMSIIQSLCQVTSTVNFIHEVRIHISN